MQCNRLVYREFYLEGYDFVGNREHPRWEKKTKFTQSFVRETLEYDFGVYDDEDLVKYVYDLYTFRAGVKPIRKKKARKKVKDNFTGSVKQAYFFMHKIVEMHKNEF